MLFDSAELCHTTGPETMSLAPKKVLIVEDEANIAQLVKLYMDREGFHTDIARTGTEAL